MNKQLFVKFFVVAGLALSFDPLYATAGSSSNVSLKEMGRGQGTKNPLPAGTLLTDSRRATQLDPLKRGTPAKGNSEPSSSATRASSPVEGPTCNSVGDASLYFAKGSQKYKCLDNNAGADSANKMTCFNHGESWTSGSMNPLFDYRASNEGTKAVCCPGDTDLGRIISINGGGDTAEFPEIIIFQGSFDIGVGALYADSLANGKASDRVVEEVLTCSNSSSVIN